MGKRLQKGLRASGYAIVGAAGILSAVGLVMDANAYISERNRVAKLVERFKSCPSRFRITKECHSPEERAEKLGKALKSRHDNNYEEAGMLFAEVNRFSDAREMAAKCSGDAKERILAEVKARETAISEME